MVDIDKNGETEYWKISLAAVESETYDYRKFDLRLNDRIMRREFREIKEKYER